MDRKFEPVLPGRQSQLPPLPAGMPRAQSADAVLPISQNTVLRNTYWLLSLSLLPTIVGAFVGMQLGLAAYIAASPIVGSLVMLGVMIGSLFVVTRLRSTAGATGQAANTCCAGRCSARSAAPPRRPRDGSDPRRSAAACDDPA